jgi:hypothetical protein
VRTRGKVTVAQRFVLCLQCRPVMLLSCIFVYESVLSCQNALSLKASSNLGGVLCLHGCSIAGA